MRRSPPRVREKPAWRGVCFFRQMKRSEHPVDHAAMWVRNMHDRPDFLEQAHLRKLERRRVARQPAVRSIETHSRNFSLHRCEKSASSSFFIQGLVFRLFGNDYVARHSDGHHVPRFSSAAAVGAMNTERNEPLFERRMLPWEAKTQPRWLSIGTIRLSRRTRSFCARITASISL